MTSNVTSIIFFLLNTVAYVIYIIKEYITEETKQIVLVWLFTVASAILILIKIFNQDFPRDCKYECNGCDLNACWAQCKYKMLFLHNLLKQLRIQSFSINIFNKIKY